MMEPILELTALSKYYTDSANVVMGLNSVDLRFFVGEFVAVTGESGSGKSTLSHVLCGVLPYESGEMRYCGEPTSQFDSTDREHYRRDAVSFISQDYGILPGISVQENVSSALRLAGMDKKKAGEKAVEILRQVDLAGLEHRRASQLSSGQKQRLSIARALAKPSRILIADEPTGNLDEENSRQIVLLLKQASKDRLVIMVTHDYQEVEGCATRHIALRDGRVILDTPLAQPEMTDAGEMTREKPAQKLQGYMASLQLRAKPGWSGLLLLFFALTAFAVFAFLGSFIVALDDTPTRIYDNSAFRNGDHERIVIAREDGEAFTQADYDAILGVSYVESLDRFGYLTDINIAYRRDVDYRVRYHLEGKGEEDPETASGITFEKTEVFAKTVPMYADGREFLAAGRLPENLYEVVAAPGAGAIGDSVTVYVQNRQNWSTSYYVKLETTVVGIANEGTGLYFHDDLGLVMLGSYYHARRGLYTLVMPCYDLESSTDCLVSEEILALFPKDEDPKIMPLTHHSDEEISELTIVGVHDSTHTSLILTGEEEFRKIVPQDNQNQVSVSITDYAYADRVTNALHKLGYVAVSPYFLGSTKQNSTLAAQRMTTLKVCLAALAACALLQIVVLRGMFGVQHENYRLLSNIGLTARTAGRSMVLQHVLLCLAGQLIGFAGILACSAMGIKRIVQLVYYLPPVYAFLLCGIHFLLCLLTAMIDRRDLTRKVYPDSGRFNDLEVAQ